MSPRCFGLVADITGNEEHEHIRYLTGDAILLHGTGKKDPDLEWRHIFEDWHFIGRRLYADGSLALAGRCTAKPIEV